MDVGQLNMTLLVAAGILLVAVGAVRVSARLGLPTLLVYLGLGLLLGESGAGVRFHDPSLARSLGFAALAVILIEGGLTTQWRVVRPAMSAGALLATLGVAVSAVVTGAAAGQVLGGGWRLGALCGAVLSPTDAAAVFSTLRRLRLPARLTAKLEVESGFNDAPAVLLVVALSTGSHRPLWAAAGLVVFELALGLVVGLAVGFAGAVLLRRVALPATGLYPLATVGFAVLAYAGAAVAGGSGFLAAYLAALVLGNAALPHRAAVRSFSEGLAWLAQIGLFVMLGLLASPARLPAAVLPAVAVGAVLLLVARPLSVVASLLPLRPGWRDQAFLSWAGLRGAVPIVLATVPLTERVAGATRLFDLVFVLVILFTLLQAPTLPWAARRLGLVVPTALEDLDVEVAPVERMHAELLHFKVPAGSRLNRVEVSELRLPPHCGVLLLVRDGVSIVPGPTTTIAVGDELLVVTPVRHRPAVERRFRLVHEGGRTARGWYGDPRFIAPRRAGRLARVGTATRRGLAGLSGRVARRAGPAAPAAPSPTSPARSQE